MFSHHCSVCDTTYLFFPSDIATMSNTDRGVEISFDCLCGAAQTQTFGATGAPAESRIIAAA